MELNHRPTQTRFANARVMWGCRAVATASGEATRTSLPRSSLLRLGRCVAVVLAVLLCDAVQAATWYVSANGGSDSNTGKSADSAFATIQKAVDCISSNDLILVDRGEYSPFKVTNAQLGFELRSVYGADQTVIDAKGLSRCVTLPQYASSIQRICGFTIRNGYVQIKDWNAYAGGAYGGTLEYCLITNNFCKSTGLDYYSIGGGCYASVLKSCRVVDNKASCGGGIANCIAHSCMISKNNATSSSRGGGGEYSSTMYNCTLSGNVSPWDSTTSYLQANPNAAGASGSFYNCIIWGSTENTTEVNCFHEGYVLNCSVKQEVSGNTRDVGNNDYVSWPYDLNGNPRICGGIVDLGAYEFQSPVAIKNVTATPRYPWSGKVDVDFALEGDADEKYVVELSAKDMVGGTNLPVRTVGEATSSSLLNKEGSSLKSDGDVASPLVLRPGTHRLIWDADADISADADFPRVTMTASALLQQRYSVKFNANGGSGTMVDQVFVADETKPLTANAFTRTGYAFSGWATNATGEVVYADKAEVKNLTAKHRGVVELFAVWREVPLYMVVDLTSGSSSENYPVSYLSEEPKSGWTDEYKTTKLVLRRIAKGSNAAGGSMSKDMWVGVFEVTKKQWQLVCGELPAGYEGVNKSAYNTADDAPVVGIDFAGYGTANCRASYFLNRLRARTTLQTATLPTAKQWEYACRSGTTTALNNGKSCTDANLMSIAWFLHNDYIYMAHPVGRLLPNDWGLYDMHGNACEQVSESLTAKGGSWDDVSVNCAVTASQTFAGGGTMFDGFRVFADVE